MKKTELERLEALLGYSFKFPKLLEQACTRRSYSKEHPGCLDNEVLEFYGDRAVEIVITKAMCERYGYINGEGAYFSHKDEGELTQIKTDLVCGKAFALRADKLDLENYLILGNGDAAQNVRDKPSVQEDLLEALVGAIAVDSSWDSAVLTRVVERLLDLADYLDGVQTKKHADIPRILRDVGEPVLESAVNQLQELWQKGALAQPRYDYTMSCAENGTQEWSCVCSVRDIDCTFSAVSAKKASAKKKAAFDMLCHVLKALAEIH